LKGRGFEPRRKCREINSGFSRRGTLDRRNEFFSSLLV
jgi:hypothetical protein